MNDLFSWDGRTEDIAMSYGITMSQTKMLPADNEATDDSETVIPEGETTTFEWADNIPKADKIDYAVAICCGAFSGLIDVLFVGELSIERANEWGDDKVNKFVLNIVNREREREGKSKFSTLEAAIRHLEQEHGMAADKATGDFGGGYYHHFRDFSHHFSPVGLACSLFTQFSGGKAIGTDVHGNIIIPLPDVSSSTLLGKNFEEKVTFGIIEWFLHLVSDMAGSSNCAGKGTGIPGPIVSMLKELSALPLFKDSKSALEKTEGEKDGFRVWLSKLFTGTLLGKHDSSGKIIGKEKFDLRTEIGVLHEAGRQLVPVIVNECLIRASYFIRRLYIELHDTEITSLADLKSIDATKLVPFNNPVVRRMVTVSSGTLVAVDASDAFLRSLAKNKTIKSGKFWVDFAVRINIAGVGRFAVACAVDVRSTMKESQWGKLQNEAAEENFEKEFVGAASLSLDFSQYQMLCSLKKLMLDYDIRLTTKDAELSSKKKWRTAWVNDTLDPLPLIDSRSQLFFLSAKQVFDAIDAELKVSADEAWLHLVLSEAALFEPYEGNIVREEGWKKKGSYKNDYLEKVFVPQLHQIDQVELKRIRKAHEKYEAKLTGSTKKKVISAVGTGAVVVATGGAAAYFAPAIAPTLAAALFGETVAGLSGASLVSASLAAFGGGALAAGGFGMAGGTAVIAGGGALLGLAGGTGASALASIQILSSDSYVLEECTKMLAYSEVALVDVLKKPSKVAAIHNDLLKKTKELEQAIEHLKQNPHEGKKDAKKRNKMIKSASRSIRYMTKTCELLKKIASKK